MPYGIKVFVFFFFFSFTTLFLSSTERGIAQVPHPSIQLHLIHTTMHSQYIYTICGALASIMLISAEPVEALPVRGALGAVGFRARAARRAAHLRQHHEQELLQRSISTREPETVTYACTDETVPQAGRPGSRLTLQRRVADWWSSHLHPTASTSAQASQAAVYDSYV